MIRILLTLAAVLLTVTANADVTGSVTPPGGNSSQPAITGTAGQVAVLSGTGNAALGTNTLPSGTDGSSVGVLANQSGSVAERTAAIRFGELPSMKDFNAVGFSRLAASTGPNDTTYIQNAINAMEATGTTTGGGAGWLFVHGCFAVTGLTVTRPLHVRGDGPGQSCLLSATGSTAPVITMAMAYDTVNYYAAGNPPAELDIEDIEIGAPSQSDVPGQGVAHGIAMTTAGTNPIYASLYLRNVRIDHVPGNSIDGTGFGSNGFLVADHIYAIAPGGVNLNCVSDYDWRISNSDFSESTSDNIVLSSCAGIRMVGDNIYNGGRYNVNYFQASGSTPIGSNAFIGGGIDHAAQDNIHYNQQGSNISLQFIGTDINNAGVSAANTYSDIDIQGAANFLTLVGGRFGGTYAFSTGYNPKFNVTFEAGSTGNPSISAYTTLSGVTPAQAYSAPTRMSVPIPYELGPFVVTNSTQYQGITLSNGGFNIAGFAGYGTTGDTGVMFVNDGGVTQVQLSSNSGFASSFINNTLFLGNGGSNAAPVGKGIQGTNASGSNVSGANITINGGQGTGTGNGGTIALQTAPAGSAGSTSNPLVTQVLISSGGSVQVENAGTAPAGGGKGAGSINVATGLFVAGNQITTTTAPTIVSGFSSTGTAASVTANNGAIAFSINVGTGTMASTGVIGLPTAAHGWAGSCHDVTTPASNLTDLTASGASSATVTNYSRTAGTAQVWPASEILECGFVPN